MHDKKIGCLSPAHHRSQLPTVLSPESALDHYSLWRRRVKNDVMLECTVLSICCNKLVWYVVAFNFVTQEIFRACQMWFCYTIGMSWKVKREGSLRKTLIIPTRTWLEARRKCALSADGALALSFSLYRIGPGRNFWTARPFITGSIISITEVKSCVAW